MNQDFMENDKDLELVGVDSVIDSLSTLIEQGSEKIVAFISSDDFSDLLAEIKELGAELSKAIKVVKIIRKSASIPDKLFMHKMERYCAGLVSIPSSKREKYAAKVGKKSLNKDSVFILGVLNKIEELSKIDILVRLFEAKMDEEIDDQTYRRMMLQVDRTMYSDILFLKDNICDDSIKIASVEEENLLATGWLIFAGIGIGTATEEGGNLYSYTQTAKQFCNVVFQSNLTINNNTSPMMGGISFDIVE
ncbi:MULTISPECIES: hypothetical protein [unclassified Ruminococcus]|uniref:hypothetical protein n=1 Tax=unclassified Ruminococcus TaxID=2608920 RepID=UPI0018AC510C|nr:hypothetical protein [Ruminococcus sp. 1001136sp1]MDB8777815.1 hypothetical protein [Ruminococcus sp. 1001136sp1]